MKWDNWGDEIANDIEKAVPEPVEKVDFTSWWVKFFSTSITATGRALKAKMQESHDELDARIKVLEDRLDGAVHDDA